MNAQKPGQSAEFAKHDPQIAVQRLLNERFLQMRMRNPGFSLRAFARKLAIGSPALSEILNGKRSVSYKLARRIAEQLCLDPEEAEMLLGMFARRHLDPPGTETATLDYRQLTLDQFKIISEWYHYAIVSLAETEGFSDRPEWIARRLNIKVQEARTALERLERLEMLERDARGRLRSTGLNFNSPDMIANIPLRQAHAHNLELARESLENDDISIRDFVALTMPADPDKLPEARRLIRTFRDKMFKVFSNGKKREVYKVCVQLFPLSNKENRK